ncbi:MAG: WD40 repeat domain-containing protein [Fuerstiella sp.]
MQLVSKLGDPTWSCEGADLCFAGDSHLCAVDYDGLLHLFDLSTGESKASWSKQDEQLNRVAFDDKGTFFVGGSFGCIYSLAWRGDNLDLCEEREVVPYVDALEYSEKHRLLAVVCEGQLKLLPHEGETTALTLRFSEPIRSVQWCEQLDVFLILCADALYSVTPLGDQSKILGWESRLLAARFNDRTDSFILLCGLSDNEAELVGIDRSTKSIRWKTPVLLDRFKFEKVDAREWDHGVGSIEVHSPSGDVIVAGVNWVGRYNSDGALVGRNIDFSQMVESVTSSTDGCLFAVSLGGAGLHVWDQQLESLLPRDCHYSSVTGLAFAGDDSLVVSSCDFSPEVICWDVAKGRRLWADDFGGYWSDGVFVPDLAQRQFAVASSTSRATKLVAVSQTTGKIEHEHPIKCGFRAALKQLPNGEASLTPSWAYGPSGVAAVLDLEGFEVTKILAGDYRLSSATANPNWVVACDRYHIWTWQRNNLASTRDLELPEVERRSPVTPIVSTMMIGDDAFIAVSRERAYRYSLPAGQPRQIAQFPARVSSVSSSKNGKVIVGFEDGHAELRSLPDFKKEHSWVAHSGCRVTSSTFAHGMNRVATGASDGSAAVWDL